MAESKLTDEEMERGKVEVLRPQARLRPSRRIFSRRRHGTGPQTAASVFDDLDWFTPGEFDAKDLIAKLKALPRAPSSVEQGGQYTVRAYYDKVETSFIMFAQVPARPEARDSVCLRAETVWR